MSAAGQPPLARRKLGDILTAAGVVDELQLRSALGHQRQWGGRLGHILIDLHFVDEYTLAQTLSLQLGLELWDLANDPIDSAVVRLLPQSVAERHAVFPVRYEPTVAGGTLTVAFSDPTNLAAIDEVRFQTGKTIQLAVAAEGAIAVAIRRHYYGEEPQEIEPPVEPATLFGNVDGFLSSESDDELAELEPIPSDSQIPELQPLTPVPLPAAAVAPPVLTRAVPPGAVDDPLQGFFAGATAPVPAPGAAGGERAAAHSPLPVRNPAPALQLTNPSEPADHDIFGEVVDLNEKTVAGVVLPATLLQATPPQPVREPEPAGPTVRPAPRSPVAATAAPTATLPAAQPVPTRPPSFDRRVTAQLPALQLSQLAGAARVEAPDTFQEDTRPAFQPARLPLAGAANDSPFGDEARAGNGREAPPATSSSLPGIDVESAFDLTFGEGAESGEENTVVLEAPPSGDLAVSALEPSDEAALAGIPSPRGSRDSGLSRALQALGEQELDTGNWHFAPPPTAPPPPAASEAQYARALARLVIRKGLIDEAELLVELSALAEAEPLAPHAEGLAAADDGTVTG